MKDWFQKMAMRHLCHIIYLFLCVGAGIFWGYIIVKNSTFSPLLSYFMGGLAYYVTCQLYKITSKIIFPDVMEDLKRDIDDDYYKGYLDDESIEEDEDKEK